MLKLEGSGDNMGMGPEVVGMSAIWTVKCADFELTLGCRCGIEVE